MPRCPIFKRGRGVRTRASARANEPSVHLNHTGIRVEPVMSDSDLEFLIRRRLINPTGENLIRAARGIRGFYPDPPPRRKSKSLSDQELETIIDLLVGS